MVETVKVTPAHPPKRLLRGLLALVVLSVVFEGLFRRLAGAGAAGKAIFFLKDILVLGMVPPLLFRGTPPAAHLIGGPYRLVCFFLLPLLVLTAVHSPALALFGAKQYLLFPTVGLSIVAAFYGSPRDLLIFARRVSILIVPTSLLAFYQLRLPVDHWLNLSPEGLSLENFSAGGRLRVCSTFPFVAQFCMFLNAAIFFAAIMLFARLPEETPMIKYGRWALLPLLILASFATGSRAAIVGGGGIITASAVCLLIKGKGRSFLGIAAVGLILLLLVGYLSVKFPEYFEAYTARKEGTQFQSHDAEMADRITGMFTRWYSGSDLVHNCVGYGLGIMSNGSEQISSYAAYVRMTRGWGETELANVFLEGGLYLLGIWLTFKGVVLWRVGREYFRSGRADLDLPIAFVLGYAVISGIFGTVATQPPIAVWWWLSIGVIIVLCGPDQREPDGIVESEVAQQPARMAGAKGRSVYAERLHRSSQPK